MTAAPAPGRVFVSYTHESEEHRRAVLGFAQQLRRAGFDCWLDQFEEVPPPASWPQWMYRQLSQAEVVLVVCTESYRRRVEGREAAGVGLGARWEGAIITQELYEQPPGGRVKYVPVVFSSDDTHHIPYFLRSTTHHVVRPTEPATYAGLLRQLSGRPTAVPEPLGVAAADPVPVPVVTADPGGQGLPAEVSLLDLLGRESLDPDRLRDRWRADPGSPGAVLGVGDDGPVAFEPAADGPHYLVAGAVGTGKSTLLRTMVAALTLRHPPDAWRFLLVDYKGGAALAPLAALPHTIGVVDDLDRGTSRRLLRMLRAEARRRELALDAAGASNMGWLAARSGGAARPGIPRLLVVVDEFASLVAELPDLVAGLAEIARRGRSLGIHLVFGTQRASRAVTPDLRAQLGAVICLRVADPSDSQDALGSPTAAALPRSIPGRALQSLHGRFPRTIQVANLPQDELEAVVAAATAAAGPEAETRWPRWPPPLPGGVVLGAEQLAPASEGFSAVAGLADLPDELIQAPWVIDLRRSAPVLAVGTKGSGRTTWLTTMGRSLAARHGDGWDLLAAGLDGEPTGLAGLPQCRAAATDAAQSLDVVLLADAELTRRRIGARLLRDDPAAARRPGADPIGENRRLVVAVDRLDLLLERGGADELLGAVMRLATDGPQAGVHLLATAGVDGAARHDLAGRFSSRLLLWLGLPESYKAFDVAPGDAPDMWPGAGRGLWLPDLIEVQVATIG